MPLDTGAQREGVDVPLACPWWPHEPNMHRLKDLGGIVSGLRGSPLWSEVSNMKVFLNDKSLVQC
eukprot:4756983-Amphidinium_carterae.3